MRLDSLLIRSCVFATFLVMFGCGDSEETDDDDTTTESDHDGSTMEGAHDTDAASEEGGEATGSSCPSDNDLTYETFGAQVMSDYCVRCHSSELEDDARNGAPLDHDFDRIEGILSVAEHIDEYAAAGPDALNETMPPNGDKPSVEQREMLGQWLACELEQLAQ